MLLLLVGPQPRQCRADQGQRLALQYVSTRILPERELGNRICLWARLCKWQEGWVGTLRATPTAQASEGSGLKGGFAYRTRRAL